MLSSRRFVPCEKFVIHSYEKFEVENCHYDSEIELLEEHHFHQTASSVTWLPFVRAALQDSRVVDYFEMKREASPPKFLKLPFIRQFSISEGIKVYYV